MHKGILENPKKTNFKKSFILIPRNQNRAISFLKSWLLQRGKGEN